MANFVYSTLSSSVTYENHQPTHDMPRVIASVTIGGGAGVIGNFMQTPKGVCTEVTDEELEALRSNSIFQLHEANGFIKVEVTRHKKKDVEVAVADMQARDPSAPTVPEDFVGDLTPPVVSKK